jgi:hypothetical protein
VSKKRGPLHTVATRTILAKVTEAFTAAWASSPHNTVGKRGALLSGPHNERDSMKQLIAAFAITMTLQGQALVPRPAGPLMIAGRNALAQAAGRVTVLAFVSTQCSHCAAVAKLMQARSKSYPSVFFEAIAFDENADAGLWLQKLGLGFSVWTTDRATAMRFLGLDSKDSRIGTPQMVYLDKTGEVRAQSERLGSPLLQTDDYMQLLIKALLAPGASRGR